MSPILLPRAPASWAARVPPKYTLSDRSLECVDEVAGVLGLTVVFDPALAVGALEFLEYTFDFDVSVEPPSTRTLIAGTLDLVTSSITGDAAVEVSGVLTPPGTPGGVLVVAKDMGGTTASDTKAIAGLTSVSVATANIQMEGFLAGTSASLTQFDYSFTLDGTFTPPPSAPAPEPSALALLGLGVMAMAIRRRRVVTAKT